MSYKKVQELARKVAESALDKQYQEQRIMLEKFNDNFQRKFRANLNEMEGDLFTLKERGFDRNSWKELGLFWRHLIELYKQYNENKPYESVQKLIDFLTNQKTFLVRIIPAIRAHLKNTEVDFKPSKMLQQARADGLKNIILLAESTGQFMKKNPLIEGPREAKTIAPPKMQVIPDPEFKPVGSEQGTKVDIPIKKKEVL